MLRALAFFILTLLAVDLSPSIPNNEGFVVLLIASPFLLLIAANQKKLFKPPLRELILFSEFFLLTLLFFFWIGIRHTPLTISYFLALYFLSIGFGVSWNLALFLLPFSLPFLTLFATFHWLSPWVGEYLLSLISFLLLAMLILFLPFAFQWMWRCQPIPHSPLRDRLDILCKRYGFHHGGILIWNVMRHATNAAIIGIIPRFRYILFTESLLRIFPEEEVEAVMAHEMGHAVHKHLLMYPFLFVGLTTITALLSTTFESLSPLLNYSLYVLIFFLYFVIVIGFFSRNFERQADLHVFAVGLKGHTLATALNRLSHVNSLPLKKKNWHHGSLDTRITFLQKAEANPKLIKKHHRKVRYFLITYLLINLSFWSCWIFLN